MKARRVLITDDPYRGEFVENEVLAMRELWPCSWVALAGANEAPVIAAYRRVFEADEAATARIHVSADERYELYLDGERIGRGPERGAPECWFFETYDIDLSKGAHVIVARVWSLGGLAPMAQLSVRHSFLLGADGASHRLLSTGVSAWEGKRLEGCEFVGPGLAFGTGARIVIDGAKYPWGAERGEGDGWTPVVGVESPTCGQTSIGWHPWHRLAPAMLPPMMNARRRVGLVRHVDAGPHDDASPRPVRSSEHLAEESDHWEIARSGKTATVPPHTTRRVIYDLENYYCAYPEIVTSQGRGAVLRMTWVESLHEESLRADGSSWWRLMPKGHRDLIEGKYVLGVGDTFRPDGGTGRRFGTLWWRAGRYVEVIVQTAGEPLTIDAFDIFETRYPLEMQSNFECDDERIERVTPLVLRGLQCCSHETPVDAPGHEQHLFSLDTRLAALTEYAMANDDRLARKALRMHDSSRSPSGLTRCCYPSRLYFLLPSYSLFWIAIARDFALWRGDREFVRGIMPGVRAVIDAHLAMVRKDGLLDTRPYWNWFDWVADWKDAVPAASRDSASGILNWQFVGTLRMAAELEEFVDEPEMAARTRRLAAEFAKRTIAAFWNKERSLFADGENGAGFYEHTQLMAILSGALEPAMRDRVAQSLFSDRTLTRATIYISHYLMEVCALYDRMDVLFDRMGLWFDLEKEGLKAAYEMPDVVTRADCFGWGGYPIYHYFATILGIRPDAMGFENVSITPHLGHLQRARGEMVHPKGLIEADFRTEGGALRGTIALPKGMTGIFRHGGRSLELRDGRQEI